MSGEINLTQDKDGRADKRTGVCIHPALTTGDLTVFNPNSTIAKCKATCDTGSWPEQHTSNLQPGPEGIGPARKHPLCKATLTRRHGGFTGLPIWHLAPSSHQPLRPSTAAAAAAAPCNRPKAAASGPTVRQFSTQSQSRAVRLTSKPIVPPKSTGRQTWCRPLSHAHASTHPARQSCICHRGLTPSSPWRVGDNLQFRCEGSKPTPPGPHIKQRTTLLTITYPSPRFEFRAHRDSALRRGSPGRLWQLTTGAPERRRSRRQLNLRSSDSHTDSATRASSAG